MNTARAIQELQLMKATDSGGTSCYLLPLNASDSATPKAILNATLPVSIIILRCFCSNVAALNICAPVCND